LSNGAVVDTLAALEPAPSEVPSPVTLGMLGAVVDTLAALEPASSEVPSPVTLGMLAAACTARAPHHRHQCPCQGHYLTAGEASVSNASKTVAMPGRLLALGLKHDPALGIYAAFVTFSTADYHLGIVAASSFPRD